MKTFHLNGILLRFIMSAMSDQTTQDLPDTRSFDERVFARFDSLDARMDALESQAERRALEIKLRWEHLRKISSGEKLQPSNVS